MKIDTSSYYPKSPLDDDFGEDRISQDSVGNADSNATPPQDEPVKMPEPSDNSPEAPRGHDRKLFDEPQSPIEQFIGNVATAISWICVPLMMPVYGILLIFGLSFLGFAPAEFRTGFTLIVAVINVVLPSIMVIILKRLGLVDDLGLNGQRERLIPYLITILLLGGTAWLAAAKGFPLWVVMFFAAGAAAGIVEFIVNFWWKISAHAAGIAGIVALLLRMSHDGMAQPAIFTWLIISVLAAGLVGSARLWLNRHTLAQVLAGYAVGFCSVYFLTMIH